MRAKPGIPNSPQSPYIGQNPDMGISNFWISGQFIIKKTVVIPEPVMILT